MDYENEIDKIRNDSILHLLKCVEEDCKDEDYIPRVNDLICYFSNIKKEVSDINTFSTNIQTRLNSLEELSYKRPWNKLNNIQKGKKLEEFINDFFVVECLSKHDTIKKIHDSFNNNKLNSSKNVNYDPLSSKVLSLTNLKFNKETKSYEFA